jgi:endonuclease/exonuclease/phosphatase (EEP) superfamily protein YafD
MNGNLRWAFIRAFPAIGVAVLFACFWFQLQIMHVLAMLYLFLDYLLVAAIVILIVVSAVFRALRMAGTLAVIATLAMLLLPAALNALDNRVPATGPTLKVATFNWLMDRRDRRDIYDWIAKETPDILTLQEVDFHEPGVAESLGRLFPYRTQPVEDVVILSKFPIAREKAWTIVDRSSVRAEISIGGARLTVWNVHPSTLKSQSELAARDHYLSLLAEKLDEERGPLLVMGDFNATRWDPQFRGVARHGRLHEEAFILALPTRMGVRSGLPFIGAGIDHVLTSRGNVLTGCTAGPLMGSDHRPVTCMLQLGETP